MQIKRKMITAIALSVCIAAILLITAVSEKRTLEASCKTSSRPKIIIDAGHEGLI